MKFRFLIYILIILSPVFSGCKTNKEMINKTIVSHLDADKYLGTWYELARYPNRFEKDLVGTTATYSKREDGLIKVVNSGYKNNLNGQLKVAIGKAKIPDIHQPAKLKVSFFWFFYADYLVLELDDDYQWAVVGSSSDKYLWILSRVPHIDPVLKNEILSKIEARGYDISKLYWVEQPK